MLCRHLGPRPSMSSVGWAFRQEHGLFDKSKPLILHQSRRRSLSLSAALNRTLGAKIGHGARTRPLVQSTFTENRLWKQLSGEEERKAILSTIPDHTHA